MPWEKSFDLDEAVDQATKVFWSKGYEATSMADLVTQMGINKGSLYNAFGSKKELFTRALLKYDRDNKQNLLQKLEALEDPVEAISTLFETVINDSINDSDKKGCLIINTALELPNHTDDIQKIIDASLGEFEAFFKSMIKQGQERGAIPKKVIVNDTAKSLLALVIGLRVLSRGVFDVAGLTSIKKDALRLIT